MNTINTNSQTYWDLVQKSIQTNTLIQVADAKQEGNSVNVGQLQQSNQYLRDTARETGVELYSQQLTKQSFETYVESSQQLNDDGEEYSNSATAYTFDPQAVNDSLEVVQKRAVGVSLYEKLDNQTTNGFLQTAPSTLNVYA